MKKLRILIIEDSLEICQNIADFFEEWEHILDFAYDGKQGLELALANEYDVIVLDLMLPHLDGLTMCARYRKQSSRPVPILMLTALGTLDDKLAGFEQGADDYLTKPFAMEELLARLKVLASRKEPIKSSRLSVGDLDYDVNTEQISRQGQTIQLSPTCRKILKSLMQATPNVIEKRELEFMVWGDDPPSSDSLRSHWYMLRQKVDKPFGSALLHRIQGTGFVIKENNGT